MCYNRKNKKRNMKKILVLNVSKDTEKFLIMNFLKKCEIVFMEDVKSGKEMLDFDFVYMHHISPNLNLKSFYIIKDIVEAFGKVLLGSVLTPLGIVDNHNIIFFEDWNQFKDWFYNRINQN